MTADWQGYEIYVPSRIGLLRDMSRADARASFDELMAAKQHRLEVLRNLVARDGLEIADSDEAIRRLDRWFVAAVREDPGQRGRLTPESYSVVNDIALFLGDVMIERAPNLHWEFYLSTKNSFGYQRHVIAGFPTFPADFDDIDRGVAGYGQRAIEGRADEGGYFVPHITTVLERAS